MLKVVREWPDLGDPSSLGMEPSLYRQWLTHYLISKN